ncbi:hypothetical protein PV666_05450 [Streptomyces acidiscabies]|uniref:Translation initiation factor IF-2 n=1 Tax=Streptomyces acidiscabies TaxID=42234 RepID=A0AAP6BE77_9ACTN|nr:hypothetical protein [Streptomyces acidiscabies]MDX2963106.1 hypothetical protein [Streptomyces acidiscabies]MDX3017327.1 hypothetical protein [Streptomyces acidiscabies]MDX3787824.1 hypothetical protein [Streptomyces acidiscabies]
MLGVARTLTSATRVLDVMELLRVEDGIEKYYTVNPGSAFADGLHEYLVSVAGARVLTWEEATRRTFQLAVACAVHPTMRRLDAPLMVMPHGAGYNRLVSESTGDATSPAGLSRRELTHRGKVIPAAIGVSHPDQLVRLLETCPEAVPRAEVIGDWCAQRIRDSEAQRDCYRARFGVTDGRRLVVLHSTWSEHSLLGRHPRLPLDLVAALPADEFAVAAVFHPNVWARHTRAALLERLREAMNAGLMVIPPHEGWRAAIVACDVVIGDHGSTTFYSAAQDRPTLLAATGLDELDPASPAAAFAATAPRLDPSGDLYGQLLRAEREYEPGVLRPVVDSQLADVEKSGERTQRRLYEFLEHRGVPVPRRAPGPSPVPEPLLERGVPPLAYAVTGTVLSDGSVDVRRRPMVRERVKEGDGFYAVAAECVHHAWFQSAEVIARTVPVSEPSPADWCLSKASGVLGADVLVARIDGFSAVVHLRDTLFEAYTERPWGGLRPTLDPLLLGAALHLWLTEGHSGAELVRGLVIRTGRGRVRVAFTRGATRGALDGV